MRVHYIKLDQKAKLSQKSRTTIGSTPVMMPGQEWPVCRLCKTRMIFFFQLDIERTLDLALKEGSHLLVFMCPIHNDAPSLAIEPGERKLPSEYWEKDFGHYRLILNAPSKKELRLEPETYLVPIPLKYVDEEETIEWDGRSERGGTGFKLGGVPFWEKEPEVPQCACGAEMIFVCQVPPRFTFPKQPDIAVQPDAISLDSYALFIGKASYIFACRDQCTPYSVYAATQDLREDHAQTA